MTETVWSTEQNKTQLKRTEQSKTDILRQHQAYKEDGGPT